MQQESLDRDQQKLGQHLRQEIKARKAAEHQINQSVAAAAAAAAADLAALANKVDTSVAQLRDRIDGLAQVQKQTCERHTSLASDQCGLQQVGSHLSIQDVQLSPGLSQLIARIMLMSDTEPMLFIDLAGLQAALAGQFFVFQVFLVD